MINYEGTFRWIMEQIAEGGEQFPLYLVFTEYGLEQLAEDGMKPREYLVPDLVWIRKEKTNPLDSRNESIYGKYWFDMVTDEESSKILTGMLVPGDVFCRLVDKPVEKK